MPKDNGHPQPDRQRKTQWILLNEDWKVQYDDEDMGMQEQWYSQAKLFEHGKDIQVPFSRETKKSGLKDTEHHDIIWYRLDREQKLRDPGSHAVLHFEAVDFETDVWINGQHIKHHIGGQTAFEVAITHALVKSGLPELESIVVRVRDSQDVDQARGKQYWRPAGGIMYTPSSGIIGQVWLESVPKERLQASSLIIETDVDAASATIECETLTKQKCLAEITITLEGEFVASTTVPVLSQRFRATLAMGNPAIRAEGKLAEILHDSKPGVFIAEATPWDYRGFALWSPEFPVLYDVKIVLKSASCGEILDELSSYLGMRKLEWGDGGFKLNGKPYFQRLVLDQGYWPDTGITAPSGEALKKDMELAKAMGFNGARKHQKIEDQRYHYWCDKLGFLMWSEMPNAFSYSEKYVENFTSEWIRNVKRSMSHPCVVAWCPINESWGVPTLNEDPRQRHHLLSLYHLTKSLDPSRPVVVNDGWESMGVSDLYGHHHYGGPEKLGTVFSSIEALDDGVATDRHRKGWVKGEKYRGQPVICSEFGGIAFKGKDGKEWAYASIGSSEELVKGVEERVAALLEGGIVQGFCWTQLADCEQEINGLLDANRKPKADLNAIRKAITQKPTYMPN